MNHRSTSRRAAAIAAQNKIFETRDVWRQDVTSSEDTDKEKTRGRKTGKYDESKFGNVTTNKEKKKKIVYPSRTAKKQTKMISTTTVGSTILKINNGQINRRTTAAPNKTKDNKSGLHCKENHKPTKELMPTSSDNEEEEASRSSNPSFDKNIFFSSSSSSSSSSSLSLSISSSSSSLCSSSNSSAYLLLQNEEKEEKVQFQHQQKESEMRQHRQHELRRQQRNVHSDMSMAFSWRTSIKMFSPYQYSPIVAEALQFTPDMTPERRYAVYEHRALKKKRGGGVIRPWSRSFKKKKTRL